MIRCKVLQHDGSHSAALFDPSRHSFRWIADYAAFEALPLRWHDDASYAAFQSHDQEDEP